MLGSHRRKGVALILFLFSSSLYSYLSARWMEGAFLFSFFLCMLATLAFVYVHGAGH